MNEFLQDLKKITKNRYGRVAFPESTDLRVLQAINEILRDGVVASFLVFSRRSELHALARKNGLEEVLMQKKNILCVGEDVKFAPDEVSSFLKASMKGKSLADAAIHELAASPLYQAGYLLAKGDVDCVLAGTESTTADVIRAALRTVGKAEGVQTVSGAFIMQRQEEVYLFADCGVVIEPTPEELVDIALESRKTWEAIPSLVGIQARLAFLSFSTKGSAQHKAATKMAEAAQEVKKRASELLVDGELQFDAAFDQEIGLRKAPGSPVAGKANIFLFPDLGAANIAYKITQRLAGFHAYGPLLQGLAKPYSDLSRGATVTDIVECTYINLLRAAKLAGISLAND